MSPPPSQKKALLLRLAYPYGKSQTWLPMDLYNVAAKLDATGINTEIIDLNFEALPKNIDLYDFIGIGVVGPPYIPSAQNLAAKIYREHGKIPSLGGHGVEYFTPEQFSTIFPIAHQMRDDADLARILQQEVPSMYQASIGLQIKNMETNKAEKYLQSEFSFFISQGCKKACTFCAAPRSRIGKRVTETFSQTILPDLHTLCEKAIQLKIPHLKMYLSPLDLFQNPRSLSQVLQYFAQARKEYKMDITLRGLSRVDSFLNALKQEPALHDLIPNAGLKIVGFGVDGTTEEVWRSQHKGKMSLTAVDNTFAQCLKLGITPEALLVMGFHNQNGQPVDTPQSLQKNVEYAIHCTEQYGVVARPHIAKDVVPGNDGWLYECWEPQRQMLFNDTKLFYNLDFVALASPLTHPNADFRQEVNQAYLEIIRKLSPSGHCVTTPLLPVVSSLDELMVKSSQLVEIFNMLVPFDR